MVKELFIAFLIALAVGSIVNQTLSPSAAVDSGAAPMDQTAQAGLQLIADVDEGSFQGMVLDSKEPVLVEFYTDECPNCKIMQPALGKLAYDGQGILRVAKINANNARALAERYDVSGVPTFALFGEGHLLDATSGARSLDDMRTWLATNSIQVSAPGQAKSGI